MKLVNLFGVHGSEAAEECIPYKPKEIIWHEQDAGHTSEDWHGTETERAGRCATSADSQ